MDRHDDGTEDAPDRLMQWGCIVTLSVVGLLSFLLLMALLFTE